MKIDTSSWKEFNIYDLFVTEKKGRKLQVPTGAHVPSKSLNYGNIPRVTVTNINNGIYERYEMLDDCNYRLYENFISVSFLGTVFYQPELSSLDMKVHCLKPIDIQLNKHIAFFLVSVIRKSIIKYVYADQLSSTTLPYLKIVLPTLDNKTPDWKYMEEYMKKIESKANKNLSYLLSIATL